MRRPARILLLLLLAALAAPVVLLNGCGNDDTTSAPVGTLIAIAPSSVAYDGPGLANCQGISEQQIFTITLSDANGLPLNNVTITINLDFAPLNGDPSLWSRQLIDGDTNQPVNVPYTTETGKFGTKQVIVEYDTTCNYKGYLSVYSATVFKNAEISVN